MSETFSDDFIEQFLQWEAASRDTIDVKRCYIDAADGDLVAGVLLSQIIYWYLPSRNGNMSQSKLTIEKDGKWWIAKKREDWWDECRISPKQFDRTSAILERLGLIDIRIFRHDGSPTIHVWLNIRNLLRSVKSILTKGYSGNSPKGKNQVDQTGILLRPENTSETTTEKEEENPLPLRGNVLACSVSLEEQTAYETPPPQPPSRQSATSLQLHEDATTILAHLKATTGNSHFSNTDKILALLRNKKMAATVEECCLVIDWLWNVSWRGKPDMLRHVNVTTPFRPTNFDNYRAQALVWQAAQHAQNTPSTAPIQVASRFMSAFYQETPNDQTD